MDALAECYWKGRCWTFAAISQFVDIVSRHIPNYYGAPRATDTWISPVWLTRRLRACGVLTDDTLHVTNVAIQPLQENRGLGGCMSRLVLTFNRDPSELPSTVPQTLIWKRMPYYSVRQRVTGISCEAFREAFFYRHFSNKLSGRFTLPRVFYAHASAFSGECNMLLEDLAPGVRTTPVNYLFGNQIWGMDPKMILHPRAPAEMLRDMFVAAAELHAAFWCNFAVVKQHPWMKGAAWFHGARRGAWSLALKTARNSWEAEKLRIAAGNGKLNWSPKLVSIIDKSYAASSWSTLQQFARTTVFTLTHGDFHAANMMYGNGMDVGQNQQPHLYLLDWSEFGVWEPTTDLAQTMISDVNPAVWREHGKDLLRAYWEKLVEGGVDATSYTFEQCCASYERGGVERWIWILSVMVAMPLPPAALQFFHDKLLAFIEDHGDHEFYILKPVVQLMPQ